MRRPKRAVVLLCAVLAFVAGTRAARAAGSQAVPAAAGVHLAPGCTYARCALTTFGSGAALANAPLDAINVANAGMALAAAGGDVTREWDLAGRAANRELAWGAAGLAGLLGSYVYYFRVPADHRQWNSVPGVGFPALVLLSSLAPTAGVSPEEHARRAVFLYNAALPRDSAVAATEAVATAPATGACDYERCALSLRGWQLVRGAGGDVVSNEEATRLFAAAGDSARVHYERFLRQRHQSSEGMAIGFGGLAAGGLVYAVARHSSFGRGVSYVLLGAGYFVGVNAGEGAGIPLAELRRAVDLYNATLPPR